MPLRYLIDENLRGPFWTAMVQANSERALPIEIACIGEYGAPRLASLDTDILIWAEQQGYVVVSADVKTMPETLARHLRNGRHLPGIFLIHLPGSIPQLMEALLYYATESEEDEWRDALVHIP
ncbi:MAG: hypothetical protein ACLQU5_17970 [Isosphaeraceae bacterium]